MNSRAIGWPDEADEVIRGDLTAAAAYVTPAGGAVVISVCPMGTDRREAGEVGFTSSLGFAKKLERIIADPHVALAYHARMMRRACGWSPPAGCSRREAAARACSPTPTGRNWSGSPPGPSPGGWRSPTTAARSTPRTPPRALSPSHARTCCWCPMGCSPNTGCGRPVVTVPPSGWNSWPRSGNASGRTASARCPDRDTTARSASLRFFYRTTRWYPPQATRAAPPGRGPVISVPIYVLARIPPPVAARYLRGRWPAVLRGYAHVSVRAHQRARHGDRAPPVPPGVRRIRPSRSGTP